MKTNSAISMLTAIGGAAMFVAGVQGQYWPDAQTEAKPKKRRGMYGETLRSHFAAKRLAMPASLRGKGLT